MKCKNCGANLSNNSINKGACEYCGMQIENMNYRVTDNSNIDEIISKFKENTNSITQDIIDNARDMCVRIDTECKTGSGFITDDDLIVTNAHVITKQKDNRILLCNIIKATICSNENEKYIIEPVIYDVFEDIAILKFVNWPVGLKHAKIGDSDKVKMGERVFTIGNPLDWGFNYTEGNVGNPLVDRVDIDSSFLNKQLKLSLTIHSGNSGGPVFNTKGEVIGICTMVRINHKKGGLFVSEPTSGELVEIDSITKVEINDIAYCVTAFTISQYLELAKKKLN